MTRRKRSVLVLILAAITGSIAYLYFVRSSPVLYRYVDRASVQYSSFVVLNPFRDSGPEGAAETVLQGLRHRECHTVLSLPALSSDRIAYLCEREQKYPLADWSLMDYTSEGEKVSFVYQLYRKSEEDESLSPPAWISVEKVGEGWRATDYGTYY